MSTATLRPTDVDAITLSGWLARGEATLIDVREADEHRRLCIAAARNMPLSEFDAGEAEATDGKRIVFHCRTGHRSVEAATRAIEASGHEEFHLAGGILAWQAAGLPVQEDLKQPIGIMRQVQLTVGAGVVAFTLLAASVSPWFLLGTGFFGAGLFFAGATGTCGMASMLGWMPWNRR
jgi:rhodanese-related sulfurtransferase